MSVPEVHNQAFSQLVTFTMAGEEYSFPINSVQEIVRLPEVTPVPGAPPSVSGVMNLRGSILPLVDLRSHFSLETATRDDETRVVIVRHQGGTTGMIVDRVNEVLQVSEDLVSPPEMLPSIPSEGLHGIAKIDGGQRVIMILSEEQVLPRPNPVDLPETQSQSGSTGMASRQVLEDEEQLVIFVIGEEEYALSIQHIREIVRYSPLTELPDCPHYFLGILSLRNQLIPVVSLQMLLGLSPRNSVDRSASNDSSRIVIVDINGLTTGLLVDAVSSVTRIAKSSIDPPPEALGERQSRFIRGIGKTDNGQRLLILLDLAGLLHQAEQVKISASEDYPLSQKKTDLREDDLMGDEKQIVCFRLANEEYGIDIMQVREIIRIDTITSVPGSPPYVQGIINLRGNVLPVIDLRSRLGLREDPRHEQNRILVIETGSHTAGLIVDAVSEVLRIPETSIEVAPPAVESASGEIEITGIGKLENGKRTIILMNTESLLAKNQPESRDSSLPTGKTTGPSPETEDSKRDLVEEVVQAIEMIEEQHEKTTDDAGPTMRELMSLKKDQLQEKAGQMGIKTEKKMTKKQIAEAILQAAGR